VRCSRECVHRRESLHGFVPVALSADRGNWVAASSNQYPHKNQIQGLKKEGVDTLTPSGPSPNASKKRGISLTYPPRSGTSPPYRATYAHHFELSGENVVDKGLACHISIGYTFHR